MIKLNFDQLPDRIYYCRHGESIGNALGMDDNSLKDLPNFKFPITEKGLLQAQSLARYINQNNIFSNIEEIYVSNFLRAQQTLDVIMKENKVNFKIYEDSRLDEWWKGIFHSLQAEDLDKHYPLERKTASLEGWYHYRPPTGEAGKDVEIRLIEFLRDLKKNALISGHGRVAGFMKRILCQEPLDLNCKYDNPYNCELWLFSKENYRYRLDSLFKP